jgi:hypothetical protein
VVKVGDEGREVLDSEGLCLKEDILRRLALDADRTDWKDFSTVGIEIARRKARIDIDLLTEGRDEVAVGVAAVVGDIVGLLVGHLPVSQAFIPKILRRGRRHTLSPAETSSFRARKSSDSFRK